jgi:membrane fusion protein (multidrug efflux system)
VKARALALCLAAAGCHAAGAEQVRPEEPAAAQPAAAGPARVVLTGVLRATDGAEIAAPVSSVPELKIRWIAEDGAAVKAGDRVVAFDDSPLMSELEQARQEVKSAERELQNLRQGNVNQLRNQRNEIRRKQIYRTKAKLRADVPADLVTARAAQDDQLALSRADAALHQAEADLAVAIEQRALEDQIYALALARTQRALALKQAEIAALVLTAPRDGVVMIGDRPDERRKYGVGDVAAEGAVVVSQPDLTKPAVVRADLIDVDDGRVAPGSAGTCTLDAYPGDRIACTVEQIAPVARQIGRATQRRAFEVILALGLTDPEHLRPGSSVKVELAATGGGS